MADNKQSQIGNILTGIGIIVASIIGVLACVLTFFEPELRRVIGLDSEKSLPKASPIIENAESPILEPAATSPSVAINPTSMGENISSAQSTDLILYDDFSESLFTTNDALWKNHPWGQGSSVTQAAGKLILQVNDVGNLGGGVWIEPVKLEGKFIGDFNTVSGVFSWDSQVSGTLYVGISITIVNSYAYSCDFVVKDAGSHFRCEARTNEPRFEDHKVLYSSSKLPVDPNREYELRIEIDPTSAEINTYVDGQLVDTYVPPSPRVWLESPALYDVHLGSNSNSDGSTYVDDIHFGIP